jgi:hypothetical protein
MTHREPEQQSLAEFIACNGHPVAPDVYRFGFVKKKAISDEH